MKIRTMFWAYLEARSLCDIYSSNRPQRDLDIAVGGDYQARRWQRYHRFMRKLEKRIKKDLYALEG